MEAVRAQVAVLSVTGGAATGVAMENVVADALTKAGHAVASFESVKNSETAIRAQLVGWIEDPDIDLVIVVGDGHNISKALAPLTDQQLPGFADLLRMLAFQEIGASAMLSTAEAARCQTTFVFVLPIGEAAVRAAMEKLILPQLDPNTQPKNLISEMPRFREEGDFTRVDNDRADTDAGVPLAIVKEKTASGAGLIPRLPAKSSSAPATIKIPEPAQRQRPSTQSRVKSATNKNVLVTKVEDPTKPIELQKLEKQIELSKTTGDSTKPMDLSRLPKLPPGAHKGSGHGPEIDQLPPEANEVTVRAPKVEPEVVTKVAPPPERPGTGPIGKPKQPLSKIESAIARATPAMPSPTVKPKAMIVEEDHQATTERPSIKKPPVDVKPKAKPKIATEEIEPIDAEEVETIETPKPGVDVVNLAALDSAASRASDPAMSLQTSELLPLDEAEERATLERLAPPEPVKKRPPTEPPPPPRRPITQPPPEPARERPPTAQVKPVAKPPVIDIPLNTSAELPAGNFDYQVKKSKLPLVLVLLLLAGLAVAGVVMFTGKKSEVPKDAGEVAVVTPPPPVDTAVESVNPDAPEEIEMEPIAADAGKGSATRPTRPATPTRPTNPTGPVVKPDAGSASAPDPKPETPDPKPPEPQDGCDEPTCVIEKYARPCCAKYKPTGENTFTPGGSDSLEKSQIRAGIDRMRPAISRCGEQHPGKGTVKVSVSVNGEGAVTSADVVEAPNPDLGKCVAGFVRKATFAKTVNGGSFTYPFVF